MKRGVAFLPLAAVILGGCPQYKDSYFYDTSSKAYFASDPSHRPAVVVFSAVATNVGLFGNAGVSMNFKHDRLEGDRLIERRVRLGGRTSPHVFVLPPGSYRLYYFNAGSENWSIPLRRSESGAGDPLSMSFSVAANEVVNLGHLELKRRPYPREGFLVTVQVWSEEAREAIRKAFHDQAGPIESAMKTRLIKTPDKFL